VLLQFENGQNCECKGKEPFSSFSDNPFIFKIGDFSSSNCYYSAVVNNFLYVVNSLLYIIGIQSIYHPLAENHDENATDKEKSKKSKRKVE